MRQINKKLFIDCHLANLLLLIITPKYDRKLIDY